MHIKDFDKWNKEKQKINSKEREFYVKEREVWWCSLGVNIGGEIDGKNGLFERPVLIIKVMSKESFLILPLTTKGVDDRNHVAIVTDKMKSFVKISQARVVSNKRFSRKVDTVKKEVFESIKERFIDYIR